MDTLTPSGPPSRPDGLVSWGTETSIVLSWRQHDAVDYWSVYCDLLDGSDTLVYYTVQPEYVVEDLGPGEHDIAVVAWRAGVASEGPDVTATVSVLGQQPGYPSVPVIVEATAAHDRVQFEWLSTDADRWHVRLLNEHRFTLREQAAGTPAGPMLRQGLFDELTPRTRYGLQVRAYDADGLRSPWSPTRWIDTEAMPHDAAKQARLHDRGIDHLFVESH